MVVLLNKIYVYNFADLRLVDHIETIRNPRGAATLGGASGSPRSPQRSASCPRSRPI